MQQKLDIVQDIDTQTMGMDLNTFNNHTIIPATSQ